MSESEECLKDCRPWGSQFPWSSRGAKRLGGAAKEKPSRVCGGSGGVVVVEVTVGGGAAVE